MTSSSPLTWNVSSSQESFHLSSLPSSVLPCDLPSMSQASFHAPQSFWCFMVDHGSPWSQLCSTRQHTKTKVKELKSMISLSGCSLLPIIRHSTWLILVQGPCHRKMHGWVLCKFYLLVWMEKNLPADSKVKRSMSWDGRLWDFLKNWWDTQSWWLPRRDKFSTPRVSQIWIRPPAHTNITQRQGGNGCCCRYTINERDLSAELLNTHLKAAMLLN